jgi:hypothetical protein
VLNSSGLTLSIGSKTSVVAGARGVAQREADGHDDPAVLGHQAVDVRGVVRLGLAGHVLDVDAVGLRGGLQASPRRGVERAVVDAALVGDHAPQEVGGGGAAGGGVLIRGLATRGERQRGHGADDEQTGLHTFSIFDRRGAQTAPDDVHPRG